MILLLIVALKSVWGGSSDFKFEFIRAHAGQQSQLGTAGVSKAAGVPIDPHSYDDEEPSNDVPCDDGDPNDAM